MGTGNITSLIADQIVSCALIGIEGKEDNVETRAHVLFTSAFISNLGKASEKFTCATRCKHSGQKF